MKKLDIELELFLHPDYPHLNENFLGEPKEIFDNPYYVAPDHLDILEKTFMVSGEIDTFKFSLGKKKEMQKNKNNSIAKIITKIIAFLAILSFACSSGTISSDISTDVPKDTVNPLVDVLTDKKDLENKLPAAGEIVTIVVEPNDSGPQILFLCCFVEKSISDRILLSGAGKWCTRAWVVDDGTFKFNKCIEN